MSTLVLMGAFVVCAILVWRAGIRLSVATDALDHHFGWGDALGGLVLLAIATNLPEIAIVVSAAIRGNISLATGNLLGGIAIQTVVLVILDLLGPGDRPLTAKSKSLIPVLEATTVITVLLLVIMGSQQANHLIWRVEPISVLIVLAWIVGLMLVRRARTGLPWQPVDSGSDDEAEATQEHPDADSAGKPLAIFVIAALVTLVGGVGLELSGSALAERFGIDGLVFGATILAAATAIPEVSTGLASIKMGAVDLAIGDVFGGNAFLPTLFLLLNLVSGQQALSGAHPGDIYLAALGCVLTTIYIVGLVWRSHRLPLRMGIDSLLVLLVYVAGIVGILTLSG